MHRGVGVGVGFLSVCEGVGVSVGVCRSVCGYECEHVQGCDCECVYVLRCVV